MTLFIPWVLAGMGLLAAAFFFARARSETTTRAERDVAVEQLERELAASRSQLEQNSRSQRKRGDDLSELRRKLEKAKKRAAQTREEHANEPARIAELEDALAVAREDVSAAREQILELETQLARRAQKASEPAAAPTPPPAPEPPGVKALEERAQKAEAEVGRLAEALAASGKELARSEAKVATSRKLYMAIRGELEAKKDRLGAQQEELERLRALKVAVIDPLPEASLPEASLPEASASEPTDAAPSEPASTEADGVDQPPERT